MTWAVGMMPVAAPSCLVCATFYLPHTHTHISLYKTFWNWDRMEEDSNIPSLPLPPSCSIFSYLLCLQFVSLPLPCREGFISLCSPKGRQGSGCGVKLFIFLPAHTWLPTFFPPPCALPQNITIHHHPSSSSSSSS